MTPVLLATVAVAGGIGSGLRYLTDNAVAAAVGRRYPWGITVVNLVGSFALGAVVGASTGWLSEDWATILGTGLIGGYTTFSTASLDTIALLLERRPRAAALNGVGMLAGCVALAATAHALATAVT